MKYLILFFFLLPTISGKSQNLTKNMQQDKNNSTASANCDIETGRCTPATAATGSSSIVLQSPKEGSIIYIGDPMCSWCWGIAKELEQLKNTYTEEYDFELIMGGLRPGGGDEWNAPFKNFLKGHWVHIQEKTGQPFTLDLLEQDYFNYDTEPACRAVRVIRDLAPQQELAFFKAIQYGFYYKNEDPKKVDFYQSICDELSINFSDFKAKFLSDEYKALVREDFAASANMGVRGFPTLVLKKGEQYYLIANGYADFEQMKAKIDRVK